MTIFLLRLCGRCSRVLTCDGVLHSKLDLHAARVRLGPDEDGVGQADLCETPELAQADRQQLLGLGRRCDPRVWRQQPAVAVTAKVQHGLALDALSDVESLRRQALEWLRVSRSP